MIISLKPENPFKDIAFNDKPLENLSLEELAQHIEYLEKWSWVIGG